MITVITTHYNPNNYNNIVNNYFVYRKNLTKQVKLITVEISFNNDFVIHDAIPIFGNEQNIMWQKERLINLAIQHVDTDLFAWIDGDLIFTDDNWPYKAEKLMEDCPIAQLFSSIDFLDKSGNILQTNGSFVARKYDPNISYGSPGGAWIARKDEFPRLMDNHVLGGGDGFLAWSLFGDWKSGFIKRLPNAWRKEFLTEAVGYYRKFHNRVGFLEGKILHLWHGDRQKRKYSDRLNYLTEHNFTPSKDICLDSNGLWKWCSDKPEMHEKVRQYFEERDEDAS